MVKKAKKHLKAIKKEDIWIFPFTCMAIVLGAYTVSTHNVRLWIIAGSLTLGMLLFTGIVLAYRYSRKRSIIHLFMSVAILLPVIVCFKALSQIG